MLIGESFSIVFTLLAGGIFLQFSSQFGRSTGAQLSEVSLSLVLGLYLIGLIQTGFNGGGIPVSQADVDYVFTSPVKTTEMFAAKILINSLTVLLAFPPLFVLYFRSSQFYGTPLVTAIVAGLVTLVYFLTGLFLSADVTLSLRPNDEKRLSLLKNIFIGLVLIISLVPLGLLLPGNPPAVANVIRILPSGVTAEISAGIVAGLSLGLERYTLDFLILSGWFVLFLIVGVRLSRRQFYELLRMPDAADLSGGKSREVSQLNPRGRSVWSVVRRKENILMRRTKETRGRAINAIILSVFLVVYSLAGTFESSPTSFLLILFIIGSFGSGNASSWMEKERLWILKTSAISLRKYVRHVFLARVLPLLLYLTPAVLVVGALLVPGDLGQPSLFLGIIMALVAAVEISAITLAGSMYFTSRYSQSTTDDILSSQTQDLADIRRFLLQTVVNLALVAPLMLLVLVSGTVWALFGKGSILVAAIALSGAALGYTVIGISTLLNKAGDIIRRREDL
jgi:hypothetical protein